MKEPSWHRRETFDRVDGTSMIVHRSKDNPARLNPPPSLCHEPTLPHTCAILSRFMSVPTRKHSSTSVHGLRNEPRYRRLIPPFRWPFTVRGRRWTSVGQEVGARERHVLRATHSCFSPGHVLPRFVWRRCFDVVVLQIDERDNRCEAKKLAKETLNAPIGFSKRTKLFSNPLGFFFLPSSSWNWKFRRSKLPSKIGNVLKIRFLMRWLYFWEIFLERWFLAKYFEKISFLDTRDCSSKLNWKVMNIELIDLIFV